MLSETSLHAFVEKGISKDEEKFLQLLFKKAGVLTLFRMEFFGAAHAGGGKAPPAKNLSDISYNNETWHTYILPKEDSKDI